MPKREFQSKSGVTLNFRPVSAWTIQHLNMKWERCKPIPPTMTTYLNNDPHMPQVEYDYSNPKFVQELKVWEDSKNTEVNEVMVRLGVTTEAPSDFVEMYQEMFGDEIAANAVKVHWVYSVLETDEVQPFFNLILGQTAATPEGVDEAAQSFRRDD